MKEVGREKQESRWVQEFWIDSQCDIPFLQLLISSPFSTVDSLWAMRLSTRFTHLLVDNLDIWQVLTTLM